MLFSTARAAKSFLAAAALLLCPPWGAAPASACLWDRDTIAQEAEGIEDVVWIIAGRFPRNPPLYYEMRLERVAREIEADPSRLALYDDAGVSCDRLGRHAEAIAWMERKRERLDDLPEDAPDAWEQNYRYLANVGTFHAHKWFAEGADFDNLAEIERGRDFIREAIELNPDAHFGREKHQLMVLEWIVSKPEFDLSKPKSTLPIFLNRKAEYLANGQKDEVALGLIGLIALGNAWESIDVFVALGNGLNLTKRGYVAYLATRRASELAIEKKRSSIVINAPKGDDLVLPIMYASGIFWSNKDGETVYGYNDSMLHNEGNKLSNFYDQIRAYADEWLAHRNAYMLERLNAGEHPDTHPNFWSHYREIPAPDLPGHEEIARKREAEAASRRPSPPPPPAPPPVRQETARDSKAARIFFIALPGFVLLMAGAGAALRKNGSKPA